MKAIYVIQARTNSSRLPAKVLLPIENYPIVVLAAKRAGNKGNKVLVFTSTETSDDYLCRVLSLHNLAFYRGSENHTLERFVLGLSEYNDNTVVVRLTADNIIPDGAFLKELVSEFECRSLNYLCSTEADSGLPYGMSAEVMRLSSLRTAYKKTKDPIDLEHVTPYLRRKYGITVFKKYQQHNLSKFRCTIDTFNDYLVMANIFTDISDAINEPAFNIINKLK